VRTHWLNGLNVCKLNKSDMVIKRTLFLLKANKSQHSIVSGYS